jgi:hypothetical protein
MRLSRIKNTKQLCQWFRDHGLTPSENAHVDHVDRVHTSGSWHYKTTASNGITYEPSNYQGTCGIDLNDNDVSDTKFHRVRRGDWKLWRPASETEALRFAYKRVLRVARRKNWPLAEAFFNGLGFKDDTGYSVNRPIGGHDTHDHFGFTRDRW